MVDAFDFYEETSDEPLDQEIIRGIMQRHTVPQIFVWREGTWKYVGEESDILKRCLSYDCRVGIRSHSANSFHR